jgi:putative spermidine/putrescine transport system permease protein
VAGATLSAPPGTCFLEGTLTGNSRRAWSTAALLAPILIVFALAYVGPLAKLVIDSFRTADGFTLAHYIEALTSPAFAAIMLRTVWMSVVVTLLCLLTAYPLAYVLSGLKGQIATGLLLLVSIPYVTSILIRTYAWIVLLSPSGPVNQALKWLDLSTAPLPLVFNAFGVYVGMVQVQLPLMIFPLYAAMMRIERSTVAAARNLGSSPASAFVHVFLPLSLPGIVSGSTLVFLSCLGFYVTPALLGGPGDYMLSQGISIRVLRLADFAGAATQASILLFTVLAVFIAFRRRFAAELGEEASELRDRSDGGLKTPPIWIEHALSIARPFLMQAGEFLSIVRRPLLWVTAICVLIYLALPLLVVIPLAFSNAAYLTFPPPSYSLRWFEKFFSNRQWIEATLFSLKMAGSAALVSLFLGMPAAFAIVRRRGFWRLPFYLLLISPLVVPQVVVAVALYLVLAGVRLTGTGFGFLVAYVILGVPYVVVVFIAGLRRFDRSLEMAAANLGAGPATTLRTVTLPLQLPTLASALLFAFIMAFDDVVFGLFIAGRGATPLPIRMWDDIRLEVSPQIAVVAVLLFLALVVFYVAQLFLGLAFRHRHPTHGATE